MSTKVELCYEAIDALLRYGIETELIDACDEMYMRNRLLHVMELDNYEQCGRGVMPLNAALTILCDYAVESGKIQDTVNARDIFDTELMGELTPRPSEFKRRFDALYAENPKVATDFFYKLSRDCNYIRMDRIVKDLNWTTKTDYGELEISINLSKPEKDPRDIAAAKLKKAGGYPKCLLCMENEGYAGHAGHPARQNLRILPIDICGEEWGFQYSPYVYYNEHCIVMNKKHIPMVIDDKVFYKLFAFVDRFPHYFVGSNADLPIVGGSILSHEHFQGGCHEFPMARAEADCCFTIGGFEDVDCSILNYPMSVIRISGNESKRLCLLADKILRAWRSYTDESAVIFAETEGEAHNTITPIARRHNGRYELDLVLRNNLTTAEHPMGLYHPHEELHHIKKENIGLIEVMGLAILPGRLKAEMQELKEAILHADDLRERESTAKHADWAEEFLSRRNDWCAEKADEIIKEEIGLVFATVLECAGVYKRNEDGRAAFMRFIASLG